MSKYSLDYIRNQIIGHDAVFKTPFGERNIFYADYTASGRALTFIEEKMVRILKSYANSHTEDDYSGISVTRLLHQAEEKIKSLVNAGPGDRIVLTGTGATGALERLQKIIGIYLSPATRDRIRQWLSQISVGESFPGFDRFRQDHGPVVFIGPYEHHSNELMWRESLARVEVIRLTENGGIDLDDLEKRLADPRFAHRVRFASFSAGSNITGLKTEVYEIARICHGHQTPVFFDFAAIAPYETIDMHRDQHSFLDAIFFSPHKFLGGPGSSGVLIFNQKLYRSDLPPTTAGGGTVDYVGFTHHDFSREIEIREKAGTPGILQAIRSALVMELKEKIGVSRIREIESRHLKLFFSELKDHAGIEFLGISDLSRRIPIISFNIKHGERILHPKFVTKLLNDLFGIQSRAGCSCAGPYGHILLDIDDELSQQYRQVIARGMTGLKPGWVRINLHYTFTEADIRFLTRAIRFVADNGYFFLNQYLFFLFSGEWKFIGFVDHEFDLDIDSSFDVPRIDPAKILSIRESYFREAEKQVRELKKNDPVSYRVDEDSIEKLKYFYYIHIDHTPAENLSCCTV
jgi:selenocysteine lyase/cysteine desulfurase